MLLDNLGGSHAHLPSTTGPESIYKADAAVDVPADCPEELSIYSRYQVPGKCSMLGTRVGSAFPCGCPHLSLWMLHSLQQLHWKDKALFSFDWLQKQSSFALGPNLMVLLGKGMFQPCTQSSTGYGERFLPQRGTLRQKAWGCPALGDSHRLQAMESQRVVAETAGRAELQQGDTNTL